MVRHSKQRWAPGATVRVGFLSYTVLRAVPTPGDGRPDQYILERDGRRYSFTPHCGIERLS